MASDLDRLNQLGAQKFKETDADLIGEKRRAELTEQARKAVLTKMREKAEKEFLAVETKRLEREINPLPEWEKRTILLDIAPHADHIRIDDKQYFHGGTYTVDKPVYEMLNEIVDRTWDHENHIGNANSKNYLRPRNMTIRPGGIQGADGLMTRARF